jgi:hypothetical protein
MIGGNLLLVRREKVWSKLVTLKNSILDAELRNDLTVI